MVSLETSFGLFRFFRPTRRPLWWRGDWPKEAKEGKEGQWLSLWTLSGSFVPFGQLLLTFMKDLPFQLTDVVRETGYAIHRYHGPGHLEKVYENALVHRLRKQGLKVAQQQALTVLDEDGTVLGEYFADLIVDDVLIVEVKAAKALVDEHTAQLLGYLRSARMEHGALVNFGAARFQVRKLGMTELLHQPEG